MLHHIRTHDAELSIQVLHETGTSPWPLGVWPPESSSRLLVMYVEPQPRTHLGTGRSAKDGGNGDSF